MLGDDRKSTYSKGSITLGGAVAMGTGVMIGAGIFALTGQIAQLAGPLFPLAFIAGAIVTGFSAYSYIRMSNKWPSSGGIAMILQKCYGPGAVAAGAALLMALSMVIAESLVARTFATYVLRPFDIDGGPLVPILAVAVIIFAFLVNIAGNRSVGFLSLVMATIKIGGIGLFGIAAIWSSGFQFAAASDATQSFGLMGFIASVAFAILAFKGFTTITNSGGEITEPNRNVGRAIMISIGICVVVYLLVAFGVGSSLTIDEIVAARDYSLAEAAEPALGQAGFILTVVLAAVATASGVLASVFAVSRMLAMLTDMKMIPHSHFGMSGPIQRHTCLHGRHRFGIGGVLRSGADRLVGRILLSCHGHDRALGRFPLSARRDRGVRSCSAHGTGVRCHCASGVHDNETSERSADRALCPWRNCRCLCLRADLPIPVAGAAGRRARSWIAGCKRRSKPRVKR